MIDAQFDRAKEDDFEYLMGAIGRYYAYDGIHFDRDRIAAGLRLLLNAEEFGCAWIIRISGAPVGYAILGFGFDLEFGGRQGTLTDLFIDPAYRRKGIGEALLEHLERFCISRGIKAIELQVESDNLEALALYEKQGFKRHTRIPMSKRL